MQDLKHHVQKELEKHYADRDMRHSAVQFSGAAKNEIIHAGVLGYQLALKDQAEANKPAEQPPTDNAHVAEGAEKFPEPTAAPKKRGRKPSAPKASEVPVSS